MKNSFWVKSYLTGRLWFSAAANLIRDWGWGFGGEAKGRWSLAPYKKLNLILADEVARRQQWPVVHQVAGEPVFVVLCPQGQGQDFRKVKNGEFFLQGAADL